MSVNVLYKTSAKATGGRDGTAAAQFLRGGKLDVERAVESCGGAIAAAGGLGAGLVEHIHRHVGLPLGCRFDGWYIAHLSLIHI